MHDAERNALFRAAVLLLAVSVLRWAVDGRTTGSVDGPGELGSDALEGHIAATAAAADEEASRSRPLGDGERIDPRVADAVELDRLPGVGPATADAIVQARDTGLVLRRPDDLLAVRGIGPATLERLRPRIELAGSAPAPPRRTGSRAPPPSPTAGGPVAVDVNRADAEALQQLPGIGPALAGRIVEARKGRPFASLDDLERVPGIGSATVSRLRGLATVGSRRPP